jgi:hypothetical protein
MRGEMRLFAAQIFGDEISSSPTGNRLKTTRKQRVGLALRSCSSWLAKTHSLMRGEMLPFAVQIFGCDFVSELTEIS